MRRLRQWVGLGSTLVMIAACHHGSHAQRVTPIPGPATLVVVNGEWLDMNAFLAHGGTTTRIGMVTATSTGTFVIPGRYLNQNGAQIRLLAQWVGSTAAVYTEPITVRSGQTVTWTLAPGFRTGGLDIE